MIDTRPADDDVSVIPGEGAVALHGEDHLAARFMFLKDFDLLDIDRGHFWYKLSWHGVHVEFPSYQHHFEANPDERMIRDYLLSLPVDVLEGAYQRLLDAPEIELAHGDHCFKLVWDDDLQRHLHCYYHRSDEGKRKDREAYESRLRDHARRYENDRPFPSQRLMQRLAYLREERAKAQMAVDAWDRLIVQLEEQVAQDQIVHTGTTSPESFAV